MQKILLIFFLLIIGRPCPISEMKLAATETMAQQLENGRAERWRFVNGAWIDLNRLERPPREPGQYNVANIHPFVFAATIVLAASGAMIWASEEDQWYQLCSWKND